MPASVTSNGGGKTTPASQNTGSGEPAYGNSMTPVSGSKKNPYTAPVTLAPLQPAGSPGIMPLSPADIAEKSKQPVVQSGSKAVPFITKSKKTEREKNRLLRKAQTVQPK